MDDPKIYRIQSFKIIDNFVIEINFKNGKKQVFDLTSIELTGFWENLSNPDYFNQVKLNEIQNLEWPSGEDFKPEHLYYWDQFSKYYPKKTK